VGGEAGVPRRFQLDRVVVVQVVETYDVDPGAEQALGEVVSDEARAARDENPRHEAASFSSRNRRSCDRSWPRTRCRSVDSTVAFVSNSRL